VPPLLVCGALVLVCCAAWWSARWITILGVLVFGGYAGWLLLGALMRKVAIRVGPAGVVLCDRPVNGDARFLPWPEIALVVVTEVGTGSRRLDRVGVLRHGEAPGDLDRIPEPSASGYTPRLDIDRLCRAVQLHAPDVRLVDLRG
jgi:hypothetical protein